MSSPTETEIQTQFNAAVLLLDEADKFLRSNTKNVLGMYDTFIAAMEGDFVSLAAGGFDQFRAAASGLVSPAMARSMLDPMLREYGKLKAFPETDPFAILERLYLEFAGGSSRVTTRAFTYGTPSMGGGNVGTGTLKRLTVDSYAYNLEAATPEVKTFRCIQDAFSGGQKGREIFEIRGAQSPRDYVAGIAGRDRVGRITCISADDSQSILDNPSFNAYGGTAPDIDSVTNWTVTGAIGNLQIETTDVYRSAVHEGTNPGSLRFETNETVTQALTVRKPTFDAGLPYYAQIAFKRESSCDGTLTVAIGADTAAVALVAQSGWTILAFALDDDRFLRGFNETSIDVTIALSGRSTGSLLVDDFVIAPMTLFDGTWWAMVGGATPFLVYDTATVTDSCTEAILQKWLWRAYGRYLPHASGVSVTWAEPS